MGARSTTVKLAISLVPLGKGLPKSQADELLQLVPPAVKVNVLFTPQAELLKLAVADAAAKTTADRFPKRCTQRPRVDMSAPPTRYLPMWQMPYAVHPQTASGREMS